MAFAVLADQGLCLSVSQVLNALLGAEMKLPAAGPVNRRLVIGSLLFGMGWGLAGFCPGPGLVALGMGEPKATVFVLAMLAGMGLFELLEKRQP